MINTKEFYDYLIKKKIDFFTGVPDSLLKDICACIKENSKKENNIITANEGNALAIACGRYLSTGKISMVYMQNSGLGNIVNPLLSLTDEDVYNVPCLFMIGYRGEPGVHDEPQHVKQGKLTLPLLETLGIEYCILDENYQKQIDEAIKYMKKTNKSYALVIKKGLFSKYDLVKEENNYTMTREEALDTIVNNINNNEFIVSTTGKTSREIFELREKYNMGHGNDFLTVGSMGHTSSIALGVSLGTKKNVYCIDGDGSFIMHMGSTGIVADNSPKNFKYILINNGCHESVGGQPTVAYKINIKNILKACGYKKVFEAKTISELNVNLELLKKYKKSALIIYTKPGSREDLGRPTKTPIENKNDFMVKIKER